MQLSAYLKIPGRTASFIARECGVNRSTITRAANGAMTPSLQLVAKIATATQGAVVAQDWIDGLATAAAAEAN